jgi:hypothetical protein
MAFGNRLTSVTQDKIDDMIADGILNSNVFFTRMITSAKTWKGDKIKRPFKYAKNTTGQSFSGFDTFSTSATDNRIKLEFDPKAYQITVAIPGDEYTANADDETKVIDLATAELEGAQQDMADDLGTIFYADGTGNSSKDPSGLGNTVDDGTTSSSYGGQTRATYPQLNSTVTASGGTLTLAKLRTLYNAAKRGSQKPTVAYTDETTWGYYEQLLQPQERINKDAGATKGLRSGTGFTGLAYAGVPVLADEKCTSGTWFFLNEDWLDWYGRPFQLPGVKMYVPKVRSVIEGNDYSQVEGFGFSATPWILPSNAAAVVLHIFLFGQLVSWNPRMHAKLTGITGV